MPFNKYKLFVISSFCLFFLSETNAQLLPKDSSRLFRPSVIIENFSSEGCSSCPEADKFLGELIHVVDSGFQPVYVLDFHVDVWNKGGWVDRYSDSLHTIRQAQYLSKMKGQAMYTPQSFLNGLLTVPGSDKKNITGFIKQALRNPSSNYITTNAYQTHSDTVTIEYDIIGKTDSLLINFAIVESDIYSKVAAGENAGKLLHHHNVVRAFKTEKLRNKRGMAYIKVPSGVVLKQSRVITYTQHERTWHITAADQLLN